MSDAEVERMIGQEIEFYCGKCKADTLHKATSVKDGKISRVMCTVCNSYRLYREKTTPSKTRAAKTPRGTGRRGKMSWDNLISEVSEQDVQDYATAGDFRLTKAIRHKTFGVGVITKVHNDTKIEVVFKEGVKLLGQNISDAEMQQSVES